MSIDKSILLDAHNIVYKNADGHDYGSFDQNMQDACNFAMVMTGHHVTMDMAYALMVGLKLARESKCTSETIWLMCAVTWRVGRSTEKSKHGPRQRTKQRNGMIQSFMQQNNRNGR